jgi:hypothetical protein
MPDVVVSCVDGNVVDATTGMEEYQVPALAVLPAYVPYKVVLALCRMVLPLMPGSLKSAPGQAGTVE